MKNLSLSFTLCLLSWMAQAQITLKSSNAATQSLVVGDNFIYSSNSTFVSTDPGGVAPPVSGTGTRLMWLPAKSAFRVGSVEGTQWDAANIRTYSFASGYSTIANGRASTAMGSSSNGSGDNSTAIGTLVIASGDYSTAMGYLSTASGVNSTAIGNAVIANGIASTAMGYSSTASGSYSTAMGYSSTASGYSSFSMGNRSTASGNYSTAMGVISTAQAYGSVAMGRYNVIAGNTNAWIDTDPLFVIGNGASGFSPSNALTVLKNGSMGIGLSNPNNVLDVNGRMRIRHTVGNSSGIWTNNSANSLGSGDGAFYGMRLDTEVGIFIGNAWRFGVNNVGNATLTGTLTQTSDKRLKRDFLPLTNSLSSLNKIKGYHYYWKEECRSHDLQTGVIAQEVEEIFPELVNKDEKGFLSVNYIGLVPHLIEAVKELSIKNEALKIKNEQLEARLSSMENLKIRLDKLEALLLKTNSEN